MDSDHQSTSNMVRGCCSEFYSVRAGSRVGSRKLKREERVEDWSRKVKQAEDYRADLEWKRLSVRKSRPDEVDFLWTHRQAYCTCAVGIGVIARIITQPRGHGHSCSADDYPSSPGGCDDVPDWRTGASNSTRCK
jgi:hypothetical protein